jgi:hypothetical protein
MLAIKQANTKNKLLFGVALNDADYRVVYKNPEGVTVTCPYYKKWTGMLTRVYSQNRAGKVKHYDDCAVHTDWLLFSNFKEWMEARDWEGRQLDKDLKVPGNKVYGPDTCLLISPLLNNLLTLRANNRGDLPIGVSKTTIKGHLYFVASCSFYGKQKRLGYYKTPEEAAGSYLKEKNSYIQRLAKEEPIPEIAAALRRLTIS